MTSIRKGKRQMFKLAWKILVDEENTHRLLEKGLIGKIVEEINFKFLYHLFLLKGA